MTDRHADVVGDIPDWPSGLLGGRSPVSGPRGTIQPGIGGLVPMEVVVAGRAVPMTWRVIRDLVVLWYRPGQGAVFDRAELDQWLADPGDPLMADALSVCLDDQSRVALAWPDGAVWPLAPAVLQQLRDHL
jgi:hypothetical protein